MVKIKVQNLVKVFGDHPDKALKMLAEGYSKEQILNKTRQTIGVCDINFEVNEAETFVLMGLSGSGKSTLLRCLNRLIEPTTGNIYIDEENILVSDENMLRDIRRKKVGMVFQRFALFPHRTVLENVAYGLEIQGISREERLEKSLTVLEKVGLQGWDSSYPAQLSGGMQQRVGLARALASDPDILLMDEAFSALDPLIRKEMQDELLSLQSELNKTIIFVTHDLDEALKLGDRIMIMKDGKTIQIGTPEEILTNPADEYVEKFVEDVDMSKILTAQGVMKHPDPVVSLKDGPRVALRLMREYGISSIFAVSRDRTLAGILTADDALRAVKEESEDMSAYLTKNVPTVIPTTPICELLPLVAETKYPVAVVNDKNRLMGIIVRGAVLAGLVRKGEQNGAA